MSEFSDLKAEYVRLAGKNPPPMSADALRARIAELSAAASQPENEDSAANTSTASEADANQDDVEIVAEVAQAPAVEPALAVDLAAELEALGLVADENDQVDLVMIAGLGGPEISLAPGDDHRCSAAEAVRLVRAGFASAPLVG